MFNSNLTFLDQLLLREKSKTGGITTEKKKLQSSIDKLKKELESSKTKWK